MPHRYRVGLYTLGCKVSQYETEAIAEDFVKHGFVECPFDQPCDIYVINTCTVTAESDRKSRQMIRRAIRQNPAARVMVVGCSAQSHSAAMAAIPGVAFVGGSYGKMRLAERALSLLQAPAAPPLCEVGDVNAVPYEEMTINRTTGARTRAHFPAETDTDTTANVRTTGARTRAYVKIEDGCECCCSYCAIPAARGSVKSRRPADVLAEVNRLAREGTREVVLIGIEIASYGADFDNYRLLDLLETLDAQSTVERMRLGSLTPEFLKEDVIARLAKLRRLTPHFHLSVQSGSSPVLAAMKRRYRAEQVLTAVGQLRANIPSVQFTADIMVGFPGESEEMFEQTLDFCRRVGFLNLHIFVYSARPGTPAATYPDQVPPAIAKSRSAALARLRDKMRAELYAGVIAQGRPLPVIFESEEQGLWSGHSDNFMPVLAHSEENIRGELLWVKPQAVRGDCLYGTITNWER
ncbi:MAG: tRNA (N(6)-L-threonylcarbamoyladenosine(37)-C(2))-methylthiotransferase MtaB [Eubacteriales bacterium]